MCLENKVLKCAFFHFRLRKAYTKIDKFSAVIGYFALREWKFHNENTQSLFKELCEADKQMFDFNLKDLIWKEYISSYVKGIRVYLLKDPMDTIPAGLKKHYKLKVMHYLFSSILLAVVLRLLWGGLRYSIGV